MYPLILPAATHIVDITAIAKRISQGDTLRGDFTPTMRMSVSPGTEVGYSGLIVTALG